MPFELELSSGYTLRLGSRITGNIIVLSQADTIREPYNFVNSNYFSVRIDTIWLLLSDVKRLQALLYDFLLYFRIETTIYECVNYFLVCDRTDHIK